LSSWPILELEVTTFGQKDGAELIFDS